MTYAVLLKRLQKLSPAELRQRVTFMEGCSDNVTHCYGVYKARAQTYRQDLVNNLGGRPDDTGLTTHWEDTPDIQFKKGQVWLLHDH